MEGIIGGSLAQATPAIVGKKDKPRLFYNHASSPMADNASGQHLSNIRALTQKVVGKEEY